MKRPRARLPAILPALVLLPAFLSQACTDLGAWDILRARGLIDEQLGSKRIRLTFDNSEQSEDLDNFPVLVVLKPGRTDGYQGFAPGGTDLRFVDPSDPIRLLDYEIELWDPSGDSFIWVKVPRIETASAADFIWMYFQNPELEESGENPQGVWSDYRLVYHLGSHPPADIIFDSSPGEHHGEVTEAMPDPEYGRIGGGFRTSNEPKRYIDTGYREDLDRWTVEAWVFSDDPPQKIPDAELASGPVLGTQKYDLVWDHPNGHGYVHCRDSDGADHTVEFGSTSLEANSWYYLAGVYDASATLRAFKNGVEAETFGVVGPLASIDDDIFIGGRPGAALVLNGVIDEVRIQGRARSADWIRAQFLSMTDAFITYGGIEDLER